MSDEYVITIRKRAASPTWLKPYREKLARANRRAAADTEHLKGSPLRPVAMNLLASKYFHEDQD